MDKQWTTGDLRRIAEACAYEVVVLSDDGSFCEIRDGGRCLGHTIGEPAFRPHLDPAQAIECLQRRFGKPDDDGFTICYSPWLIEAGDQWQVDYHDATGCARTLPAAAMAAILASLEGDDD